MKESYFYIVDTLRFTPKAIQTEAFGKEFFSNLNFYLNIYRAYRLGRARDIQVIPQTILASFLGVRSCKIGGKYSIKFGMTSWVNWVNFKKKRAPKKGFSAFSPQDSDFRGVRGMQKNEIHR